MSDVNEINPFLTAEAGNISESLVVDLEELRRIPRPKRPIYDSEYYSASQDIEIPNALPTNAEEEISEQLAQKEPQKIYHGCLRRSPAEILAMPRPKTPFVRRKFNINDFLQASRSSDGKDGQHII